MKKVKILELILMFYLLCLIFNFKKIYSAENLSAYDIMKKAFEQYRPDTEVMEIEMVLVNKEGQKWVRTGTFYNKRKNKKDDMRLFVFHSPPDLAKSGVLTLEHTDSEDDQWMYVPAYHTSRRIPASSRSSQYMGTDFYYEDIITRRADEYEYRITGKENYNDTGCTIIEAVPVSERLKKESGYGRFISWVDAGKFVILKQEFYDKNNGLIKLLENKDLKKYKDSYYWDHLEMTTVKTNHKTVVGYKKRTIDQPLDDGIFTERFLKRGK